MKQPRPKLPGRIVLALQGGGALGAYQAGVYEALCAAGIEPDWVVGTSIGAVNGALIAGNRPGERLHRLRSFWRRVEQQASVAGSWATIFGGIPRFFTSQADAHIARQRQLHRMRHVIRELAMQLPASKRRTAEFRELASYGCATTMHIVRLLAPSLDSEDLLKDIDFSAAGIRERWKAGVKDANRVIDCAPWDATVDPLEGVVVQGSGRRIALQ
jgi:hypothetical protein